MYDDYKGLCSRLQRWSRERSSFVADRALADEVLVADGWVSYDDPAFDGGVAWKFDLGGATVHVSGANRPHPVIDLNAALSVVPPGYDWKVVGYPAGNSYSATVWGRRGEVPEAHTGNSTSPCIAVLIAAVKALGARAEEKERQEAEENAEG